MLERLAVSTRALTPAEDDLAGTTWVPEEVLDAWGELVSTDTMPGVTGERLAEGRPAADLPPGLYAGDDRRLALNTVSPEMTLAPAAWPADVPSKAWSLHGKSTSRAGSSRRRSSRSLSMSWPLWLCRDDSAAPAQRRRWS